MGWMFQLEYPIFFIIGRKQVTSLTDIPCNYTSFLNDFSCYAIFLNVFLRKIFQIDETYKTCFLFHKTVTGHGFQGTGTHNLSPMRPKLYHVNYKENSN